MAVEEAQVVQSATVVGVDGECLLEHQFGLPDVLLIEVDEGKVERDPDVLLVNGHCLQKTACNVCVCPLKEMNCEEKSSTW